MSQLCKSVQYAYRSKTLVRLNTHRQCTVPKEDTGLAIAVCVLQNTYNLVISRCCFSEDGNEMYQDSKRTRTTIVLLIEPFVC